MVARWTGALLYDDTNDGPGQATFTKMIAVTVGLRPTFTAGAPRVLFEGHYGASAGIRGYDVTADGRRS